MRLNEFELIRQYFQPLDRPRRTRDGVVLGMGDDCALLQAPSNQALAMSVDTLVEGVHFLAGVDPCRLGHKALAVNLSDLAAMGAEPAWFMLALTLPRSDALWLESFSAGMAALAVDAGIRLIGGDTTRGPLSITVQVTGAVPVGQALTRSGASAGDDLYVSGMLGQGGLGLLLRQNTLLLQNELPNDVETQGWVDKLETPSPRLALGHALRGVASACIDVSDGFLQDLQHLLTASTVGAEVSTASLPVVPWHAGFAPLLPSLVDPVQWQAFCLRCGDDYELCFTAAPAHRARIAEISHRLALRVTRVGRIVAGAGIRTDIGEVLSPAGYQHF